MDKNEINQTDRDSDLSMSAGSHPRVSKVLSDWMINDAKGLTFGTDAEKAECWQKAASRLEKLARRLESELNANTEHTDTSR
jgi:hypothetical protein